MHNVSQSDQLWTPALVIFRSYCCTRDRGYWYHTVVCPSVCLSVCDEEYCGQTIHPTI